MGLSSQVQDDFSAGIVRAVPTDKIQRNGALDVDNMLFLDDSGMPAKRGGVSYQSGSALGSNPLTMVADATLVGGARTIFAGPATGGSSRLGVLDSDDSTVVTLQHSVATDPYITTPVRPVAVGGRLIIPKVNGLYALEYAGGRKANYSTGTVTVTLDSAVVTGAGTTWSTNVEAGMYLIVGNRTIAIRSVNSNTELTLENNWPDATSAGAGYTAASLVNLWGAAAPAATAATYDAYLGATQPSVVGVAGSRVLTGRGRRLRFSPSFASNGPGLTGAWGEDDFHDFPGDIVGIYGMRDMAFVFTTAGVYLLSGLALDLVDDFGNVQHRVERVSEDIVLWGHAGLATFGESVIVPARNGVWLMGTSGPPVELSASVGPYYRAMLESVGAASAPGIAAVYKNHYFLPIVGGSSPTAQGVWVCRLDRPYQGGDGRTWWPWTRMTTDTATGASPNQSMAFASRRRAGEPDRLLATGNNGRVLNCAGAFNPSSANTTDADGSTFSAWIRTRGFSLGRAGNVKGTLKRVRLRHKLEGAAVTSEVGLWVAHPEDSFALSAKAPEEAGGDTYSWTVTSTSARQLWVSLWLFILVPADRWRIDSVEILYRESNKT